MTDPKINWLPVEYYPGSFKMAPYKRRKETYLCDGAGKPMRPMTFEEWVAFKNRWPTQIEKDGQTLQDLWVLVPFSPKSST